MIITPKQRRKLKQYLPDNYGNVIAQECGCHPNTVYNVLNHAQKNDRVVEALIELARKNKANSNKLAKSINQL